MGTSNDKRLKFTKLTPETVNKLEEVFAIDGSIEEACFYANISRQTYYNWIKDNPEMEDRFDSLRQKPVLKARQAVVKGLDNFDNGLRYLERKKKLEFSLRTELTGADGGPIQTEIDDNLGKITDKINKTIKDDILKGNHIESDGSKPNKLDK